MTMSEIESIYEVAPPASHAQTGPLAAQPVQPPPQQAAMQKLGAQALVATPGSNPYSVVLGERTYYVVTVTGARLMKLGNVLMDSFDVIADNGFLDGTWREFVKEVVPDQEAIEAGNENATKTVNRAGRSLSKAVANVWDKAPDLLGDLLTIFLNVDRDHAPYIMEYLEPLVLMDIIEAFIERNRVVDVLERFFQIKKKVLDIIKLAQGGLRPT